MMAKKESIREDKIDFVSIVTPNYMHYEIAKTFLEEGINIMCEKPLCFSVEQALELEKLAEESGVLFAVTYSYSGYGMVKQAKKLVADGEIGDIINVNAEYLQEWLIDDIGAGDESTTKLSIWRKDPKYSGISNCVGDIGTHIENTVAYITGLKLKKVAAVLDSFGQALDLNANMLVEFENGAHGVYARKGFGTQMYNRGMGYITGRAAELNRIPSGHPEGLYVAFGNVYKTYINAILKKINGEILTESDLDFPSVSDGVDGVKFIHSVINSNNNNSPWTEI
jgi:predicted dehydrogenase